MNRKVLWTSVILGAIAVPVAGFYAVAHYGKQARYTERIEGMVMMFDANQDGEVGRDEFRSTLLERFDKLDQDGSGAVSLAELQDYRRVFRNELRDWKRQMKQQRGSWDDDDRDGF